MQKLDLLPMELPPGIVKNGTAFSRQGRYRDGNLIRWVNGELQPIGGWQTIVDTEGTSVEPLFPFRSINAWRSNNNDRYLVVSSSDKLLAAPTLEVGIIDITPVDLISGGGLPGGYGSGAYGAALYGFTPAAPPGSVDTEADWSMTNWGEDWIGTQAQDGRLFEWKLDPLIPATPVQNAPLQNKLVITTDERHCMLFGAGGDPRRVEWSSQEDIEDWNPTATNTAGGFNIDSPGVIIGVAKVSGGILVVTSVDAHLIFYVGPPFVYGRKLIAGDCGCVSERSLVTTDHGAIVWMGEGRFWQYDGGTVKTLECDVVDYVFKNFNTSNPTYITGGNNGRYSEAWWFYPSEGSVDPDRYVLWSYRAGSKPHWSIGEMPRMSWLDETVYGFPIATNGFVLYRQEFGYLDDGETRLGTVFAKTAVTQLGNGRTNLRVRKTYQDVTDFNPALGFPYSLTYFIKQAPDLPDIVKGPFFMNTERGYTETRFRARQVQVQIDGLEDAFWKMGQLRLDYTTGGER